MTRSRHGGVTRACTVLQCTCTVVHGAAPHSHTHPLAHPLTHSPTHPHTHSLTHSPTHPTHPHTRTHTHTNKHTHKHTCTNTCAHTCTPTLHTHQVFDIRHPGACVVLVYFFNEHTGLHFKSESQASNRAPQTCPKHGKASSCICDRT